MQLHFPCILIAASRYGIVTGNLKVGNLYYFKTGEKADFVNLKQLQSKKVQNVDHYFCQIWDK